MSILLLYQGSGSTAPVVAGNLGSQNQRLMLLGVGGLLSMLRMMVLRFAVVLGG